MPYEFDFRIRYRTQPDKPRRTRRRKRWLEIALAVLGVLVTLYFGLRGLGLI